MIEQERIRVGEQWMALALMYEGKTIPSAALRLMLDAVDDLPFEKVMKALSDWTKDKKSTRHPLPGQLRSMVNPEADPRALAIGTALKIRGAVREFGWCNPDDAKKSIGEIGWRYVEQFGGWQHICENLGTTINENSFMAQARDAIESNINLNRIGFDSEKPLLEQQNKSVTDLVSKIAARRALEHKGE